MSREGAGLSCLSKLTAVYMLKYIYSPPAAGISQRNHTACYKHLLETRKSLRTEIMSFFFDEVAGKFKNKNCTLQNY